MKRIALLAVLLLAARCASAQTYGRIPFHLQNAQGQAISGALVNVYTQTACGQPSTGIQAQLFSSSTGGTVNQPATTNGLGQGGAYAAPGCYTVVYSSPYTGTVTDIDQLVIAGGLCSTGGCAFTGAVSGTSSAFSGAVTAATVSQLSDPPGGSATALRDATQHYVDTSLVLNLRAFGCDPANSDNSPCFDTMAKNLSFNSYYLPPGTYNVTSCTPFQQLAQQFDIHGASWAASTINFSGTASATTPTNTTGWWTSGANTINSTAQPHVGDSVLAYQTIANLVLITGIQTGTTVTSVSGTGPYTVGISKPTTASAGSSGSPVPVSFGWQCIFSLGADDINWFNIHDLGFAYTNLPQAPTSNTVDYPATALLFNLAGEIPNGIHDFDLYNLYFYGGSRGIAATRATEGTLGSLIWGGTIRNILGATGVAPGTIANLQGTAPFGLQGATIDVGANSGKGGGSPRLTFAQIYNRQTIMEPLMTVQRASGLLLHNIESNSGQDVLYDFDNNPDMHGDGFHVEFHTAITSAHAVFQLFSSSGQFNNVDISSHICPSTLPVTTWCNTTPAVPVFYGLTDNGSVTGTLSIDNWSLIPYSDSLGYCSVSGTWSAGITALTLTANACSPSITSGQNVTAQGIQPGTVITVSGGPTYTLSLPPTASGSSTNMVFSTYAAYVASVGTGAVAPGSSIRGTRGFNAPLVPGDASNNLLLSAGNLFHSNPGYVVNEAASTTAPGSFVYPSVFSLGTGSTTGIPAGDECSTYLKYTGTGTFPASQYRELAICHDSGAGGLSGFGVYSSDNAVRGSESFAKTFGCDKVGNCASTGTMTDTVETESTILSAQAIGTDGTGKHKAVTVAGSGMLTLPGVATVAGSSAYFGVQSPTMPAAITLNSAELTLSTIPLTCATFPVISICSGSSSSTCYANTTLDGTHSLYAMTVSTPTVPLGTSLRLFITTPAAGCGTNAVTIGAVASYQ